jgi:outer membrane immunogenic protein
MKALFAFAAGVLAVVGPACAAEDFPTDWTGFYLGGHVGGGWGNEQSQGTVLGIDTNSSWVPNGDWLLSELNNDASLSGVFGGVQVGYNYQLPSDWLLGFETDFDASGIGGSSVDCMPTITDSQNLFPPGTVGGCGGFNGKLDYFGTVRGRIGYVCNENLLMYGTGGWAFGQTTNDGYPICAAGPTTETMCPGPGLGPVTGNDFHRSDMFGGWSAGAGVEWEFRPQWTLRLEYLHLQFDGINSQFATPGSAPDVPAYWIDYFDYRTNVGVNLVRVGLNYMF